MQSFGISNDCDEYIMNHGAMRAIQHAGKCVDCAWLPMRVVDWSMWEEPG